ncbi:hypothetical protein B0H13DRAFT_1889783 [Mycena leptocephala]|nr:hypothetical protein B0H13DRAFT_1889783 [Mycena leptocephala]
MRGNKRERRLGKKNTIWTCEEVLSLVPASSAALGVLRFYVEQKLIARLSATFRKLTTLECPRNIMAAKWHWVLKSLNEENRRTGVEVWEEKLKASISLSNSNLDEENGISGVRHTAREGLRLLFWPRRLKTYEMHVLSGYGTGKRWKTAGKATYTGVRMRTAAYFIDPRRGGLYWNARATSR